MLNICRTIYDESGLSSVADPVFWVTWIRIRENTGSGSFIHKKTPVI